MSAPAEAADLGIEPMNCPFCGRDTAEEGVLADSEFVIRRELDRAAAHLRLAVAQYGDHRRLVRWLGSVRDSLDAMADELGIRRAR